MLQQFPPAQIDTAGRRVPASVPDALVWSSNHGRAILFKNTGTIVDIEGVKTEKCEGSVVRASFTGVLRRRVSLRWR